MIQVKKYRSDLAFMLSLSRDITEFIRDEVGAFAVMADIQSGPVQSTDLCDCEVEFIVAAPTEADMLAVEQFCNDSVREIETTEQEIAAAKTKLTRALVCRICTYPVVYDRVIDTILSRFPEARMLPTVDDAIASVYETLDEES